jgi:hypothetical protein
MNELIVEMVGRALLVLSGMLVLIRAVFEVDVFAGHQSSIFQKLAMILIGVSALYFTKDRNYYLPFLGKCVMPSPVATKEAKDTNQTPVTLKNLPPNTRIIYWAATKSDNFARNPYDAYGDYQNSGMTITDANGTVQFNVTCPSPYTVSKFGVVEKQLKQHVHYRYELPTKGLYSQVFTEYISC